jgi:hypothetical protein
MSINSSNVVQFIKSYFSSIGIDKDVVANFFDTNYFDKALILNLSAVCIMPKNKPATSNSNQTHIHVTGLPRYFFFPKAAIDGSTSSSADKKIITNVSLANIKALNNDTAAISSNDLELKESFTLAKIAHRQSQENQVQLSKIKLDDRLFLELRSSLYTNDLLILLGYKNSDNLLAVGIPKDYYLPSVIGTSVFFNLNEKTTIKIKTALRHIESSYDSTEEISDMEAIDDSIYQQQVIVAEPSTTTYTPMPKSGVSTSLNERPKRSAARGKEAISEGNYQCAIDSLHSSFTSKSGFPYIEAHHLIPICTEDDFEYSLDVKGNILPLCPNCHAKIHYGQPEEVSDMIEQLYHERARELTLSGIPIDLETLKSYYL